MSRLLVLGSAAQMASPAPQHRNTRLLLLAYLPFFVWSLVGGVWTAAHHRFTASFGLGFLMLCAVNYLFGRRIGGITLMLGIAAVQALGAFALHAWLRLPLLMSVAFFVASLTLLLMLGPRVILSRRLR
jgi:hypothetical protein